MESLQFRKLKGSQGRVESAVKLKSTAELHTRSKDYSRSTREEYEEQPLHFVHLKQGGLQRHARMSHEHYTKYRG